MTSNTSNTTDQIETFLTDWSAAERAGDTGRLSALLADDFAAVGPLGFILTKQAWLSRFGQGGLRYEDYELTDISVRTRGDIAVIIGRANGRGTFHGHPVPEANRATLVLSRGADRWQLFSIQLSFIAGTAGAPPLPAAAQARPQQSREKT